MKKGIIFDVDGTLWDACLPIADSWNLYTKEHAPDLEPKGTEELIRSLCGQTMDRFAAALFPGEEPERARRLTEACCEFEVEYLKTHPGRLYPHVREVLEELRRQYPLYIVSNCQSGYVEVMLESTGLQAYFTDIEYYGRTLRQKDENIRLLCQRNGLERALYVGDTQGDRDASASAGTLFVHASYGFGSVSGEAPAIHSLTELPELAAALLNA